MKILFNLVSILFLLFSCSNEVQQAIKQEIIVAQPGTISSLDPHKANDGNSLRANKMIYSRLVEADGNMNIMSGIAESWEVLNPTVTKFKLKKNIKFHNGQNLTAEDVKFSFNRIIESPRVSFVAPPIKEIKIIDDHTIQMITKAPFAPLLEHLSHPAMSIISIADKNNDLNLSPNGTGPFKFEDINLGDNLILKRNDNYFLGSAKVEKLIFKNVLEPTNRTIGLETKEIDISLNVANIDLQTIKNNEKLKLISKPSISYRYFGINNKSKPLNNKEIRKALDYAIDKQSIVDSVIEKQGIVARSPVAEGTFGFNINIESRDYNIKKAKQILVTQNFDFSKTFTIMVASVENRQIAEIIQNQLGKIEIKTKIENYDVATFLDKTGKGEHDFFVGSWGNVTGDPDYALYAMYHSSGSGFAGNRNFYSNLLVDKLLDQAKIELNKDKRKQIYEQILQTIKNDTPDVGLFYGIINIGMQANIEGFNPHPVTLHDFYPVYKTNITIKK